MGIQVDLVYCTTHRRWEPLWEIMYYHGDGTGCCKRLEIPILPSHYWQQRLIQILSKIRMDMEVEMI